MNKNRNVRKDGSVIECEWYNSTPWDPSGKFSVLSLVVDVTEVILCDIGLPKMDGYQVAKALRAGANLGQVRLVALSGYAQSEDLQRSLDAGFDAHLEKPATIETIERVVAGAVESLQP